MKHEIILERNNLNDKDQFTEQGYELAEQIDEFDCSLRNIVAECVAEYLWRHTHLKDSNKSFCDIFGKILNRHTDVEFFTADMDENRCEFIEESKVLMKL